jgi:hypothetical protein
MVTSPQRDEVVSYLHAQAAKLTPAQVMEKLSAEVESLLASAAGFSEDEARWAPEGEWNALQILEHVLESAPSYRQSVARLTRHPVNDAFEPPPVSTIPALSAAIRAELATTVAFVRSVGDAPADRTEVSDLFGPLNWREWALFERVHVRDHVLQLRALKSGLDTPGR